jgi:adhesin/invasin
VTVTVTALNTLGNPVSGVPVTISATGSGNTITQPSLTDGGGVAVGTFSSTVAEGKTISAIVDGTAIVQTQGVAVSPAAADAASSTATVPGGGTSGSPTTITVQAKDQFGNNVTVGGAAVEITVSGANTAGPFLATDNGDGTYSAAYTPTGGGLDQVAITLNGTPISGSPFNTTVAVVPVPTRLQLFGGNNQSATVGTAVASNATVQVLDQLGNPVQGVSVLFGVTGGGGSLSSSTQPTNGSGMAGVGWTLGTTAGTNTISATVAGLLGSPVSFSATATPAVINPAFSTAVVPDGIAGTPTIVQIQGRDQFGNAVLTGGATVTVDVTGANHLSAGVTDNGDGTYTAVYTPVSTGTDTLHVKMNGTTIQGNPFKSIVS